MLPFIVAGTEIRAPILEKAIVRDHLHGITLFKVTRPIIGDYALVDRCLHATMTGDLCPALRRRDRRLP